eukprot:jgi/Chrzof1/1692/Cz10g17140.t1
MCNTSSQCSSTSCIYLVAAESGKRRCYLNRDGDNVIRSIAYNKSAGCIITVSCHHSDRFRTLQCTSHAIRLLESGSTFSTTGTALFCTDVLVFPGFVEFDDVAHKALVYAVKQQMYKMYCLCTQRLLFTIDAAAVQDIKFSGPYVLIVKHKKMGQLPIQMLSTSSGQVLADYCLPLAPHLEIELLELCGNKVIFKQAMRPFTVYQVASGDVILQTSNDLLNVTSSLFHLHHWQLFLAVNGHKLTTWDFKGNLVASFADNVLWYADANSASTLYLATQRDWIISYCKPSSSTGTLPEADAVGSINISDVLTGALIAKLAPDDKACTQSACIRRHALTDVTAVYYDEDDHTIYMGNGQGLVHKWSYVAGGGDVAG